MKLDVRHGFPCTPARFWEMYWSESFDDLLAEGNTVRRELISESRDGDVLIRRLRFTPEKDLPAPAAKLIGSSKLVYEQENRFEATKGILHWKVIPTVLPGKLEAAGKIEVVPQGAGCEQRVSGDVTVNVMFIGGQIEKAVIHEVQQGYDQMAAAARRWLTTHGS